MSYQYDTLVVGGGIMGLLGAYEIVRSGSTVAIIDRSTIGNPDAGSSGITRSLRTDYEEPQYAALASAAWDKWSALERALGQTLVVQTGCLNLAATAGLTEPSYAQQAATWLKRDKRKYEQFVNEADLQARFPQFRVFDCGVLEPEAGLGLARATLSALRAALEASGACDFYENVAVETMIQRSGAMELRIVDGKVLRAKKLVLAAGLGTPKLLERLQNSSYRLTLTSDRPSECIYCIPNKQDVYLASSLPVFACLDLGVYGHPIVQGQSKGVKIGRYHPPASVNKKFKSQDATLSDFVERFMPDLASSSTLMPVTDTDQCLYDMTTDGGFVIGAVPDCPEVIVAAGFCGTGYKFAPVVAEIICDLVTERPARYNLAIFDPTRFNVQSEEQS